MKVPKQLNYWFKNLGSAQSAEGLCTSNPKIDTHVY